MKVVTKLLTVSLGICSLSIATLALPQLATAQVPELPENIEEIRVQLMNSCTEAAEEEELPAEAAAPFCACFTDGTIELTSGDEAVLTELAALESLDDAPDSIKELVSSCTAQVTEEVQGN